MKVSISKMFSHPALSDDYYVRMIMRYANVQSNQIRRLHTEDRHIYEVDLTEEQQVMFILQDVMNKMADDITSRTRIPRSWFTVVDGLHLRI